VKAAIVIHGVAAYICGSTDDYRVVRADTGAELSRAPRRFLAIARAATLLHTPTRGAA
jgi:hypothetical protein